MGLSRGATADISHFTAHQISLWDCLAWLAGRKRPRTEAASPRWWCACRPARQPRNTDLGVQGASAWLFTFAVAPRLPVVPEDGGHAVPAAVRNWQDALCLWEAGEVRAQGQLPCKSEAAAAPARPKDKRPKDTPGGLGTPDVGDPVPDCRSRFGAVVA